jgi:hypothetical protein
MRCPSPSHRRFLSTTVSLAAFGRLAATSPSIEIVCLKNGLAVFHLFPLWRPSMGWKGAHKETISARRVTRREDVVSTMDIVLDDVMQTKFHALEKFSVGLFVAHLQETAPGAYSSSMKERKESHWV